MQYHIEPYLRELLNAPVKFHEIVIDDNANRPRLVHKDGSTQWKNGRPRKYTRAVNEIRVGHGWLVREFPVTWAVQRLSNTTRFHPLTVIEAADLQIISQREYWATWLAEAGRRKSEADWWMAENRRYLSHSLDPEEDNLLYA